MHVHQEPGWVDVQVWNDSEVSSPHKEHFPGFTVNQKFSY